ncbi:MAG: hypothetical protein FWC40_07715 [Proteobacteria bacterium]|nr:hypothetical protein [Pseudomonadota bacterium]
MPKVLILDHELMDVIKMERILKAASFEVSTLTGPYGILAKFDYEKPDILLFNPDMPNADSDALLATIMNAPSMQHMIIIAICCGDPAAVEDYCLDQNLHGFYMKDEGFDGFLAYLSNFVS